MKPKEKAIKLVDRFYNDVTVFNIEKEIVPYLIKKEAKQCALICVDEILRTNPMMKNSEDHGHRGKEIWYEEQTTYWEDVQEEIKKL